MLALALLVWQCVLLFTARTLCALRLRWRIRCAVLLLAAPAAAHAGGPQYVAGTTYFNASVLGQPIHWANGQVRYYVDQGPLSNTVNNQQAVAMVDAAAALWSAVPTAAVTLADAGPLNEDVNGSNIQANSTGFTVTSEQSTQLSQITAPADVTPAATNYPVGVIFDADGSVIDTLFGSGVSEQNSCQNNGVFVWIDNVNPDATLAHAIIILNGLCATNSAMLQMMSFELERAFGHLLNLGFSQVNPDALTENEPEGTMGWPIMQPIVLCGATGGVCIPNPAVLSYDDIAALSRIYPVTAQNIAAFPGKQLTAANTVSIQGTISFRSGMGMQGVNVIARPLDSSGNPPYQYTVTFVSGAYFGANHGNPITGNTDIHGNLFNNWGSYDASLQGSFDLSAIPLPPGMTSATYQVSFEAINPLYILENSVGPYLQGQVEPSGTLATITVANLAAGSSRTIAIPVDDSAEGSGQTALGTAATPDSLPSSGLWDGRLSQVGQSDWLVFLVRGNRIFSVVTQALDERYAPSASKAMPSLGIWDAFRAVSSPAIGAAPGLNGNATGETWLRVATNGDDVVRLGIADLRGDGRPDYAYQGWVLYADSVSPLRLPASGGAIVIQGMGFRQNDTVLIGGQAAVVTSISPNEITAIAPPASSGVTGSVDVEVDDQPWFYAAAVIPGGVSYNAGTGDSITLNTAPMNTVAMGVPLPFAVTAYASDMTPAGGVTVIYTVTRGTATLGCGQQVCTVVATGDGHATMNVIANGPTWSIVTASLTNGASLQAQFQGGAQPSLAALTPQLSLAAGATFTWTVQAEALSNALPQANQSVIWQTGVSGIGPQTTAPVLTNANGIATQALTVGPLAEGQVVSISACLNGTNQCVSFSAIGARSELATLEPVSGVTQTLAVSTTPAQIVLRVYDTDGNPLVGASVALSQALYAWTPPCDAHQACAPGNLLATQAAISTSAGDGSVTFTAASLPGVATNLVGIAASGSTSTVNVSIQQQP